LIGHGRQAAATRYLFPLPQSNSAPGLQAIAFGLVCLIIFALPRGGRADDLAARATENQASALVKSVAEPTGSAVTVEDAFGIKIDGLRLSAAGSMLDFRYRVLDAQKAAPLLNGKIQPYLVDEARFAKLGVPDTPVLGRIRQTSRNNAIHTDRTYFIMFGNPGKALQKGDKAILLLGQVKVTELTVQ
jgi:hypothetical protein